MSRPCAIALLVSAHLGCRIDATRTRRRLVCLLCAGIGFNAAVWPLALIIS